MWRSWIKVKRSDEETVKGAQRVQQQCEYHSAGEGRIQWRGAVGSVPKFPKIDEPIGDRCAVRKPAPSKGRTRDATQTQKRASKLDPDTGHWSWANLRPYPGAKCCEELRSVAIIHIYYIYIIYRSVTYYFIFLLLLKKKVPIYWCLLPEKPFKYLIPKPLVSIYFPHESQASYNISADCIITSNILLDLIQILYYTYYNDRNIA